MKSNIYVCKRANAMIVSILALFLLLGNTSFGQTATDGDYRSAVATGNWSAPGSWQVRSAGSWGTTTLVPTTTSNVYIQSGHTITVTADAYCQDLHLNSTSVAGAIVVNTGITLQVNRKIRDYTGTTVTSTGADGVFYTQVSAITFNTGITTNGTGKILFVYGGGKVINAGEWGANITGWNAEFAPSVGGTIDTISTSFKAGNITISSGTVVMLANDLRPDNGSTGGGTLTVAAGATLKFTGSGQIVRTGTPSTTSHSGTVTINGTLEYSGTVGKIDATTVTFAGTVIYSATGVQTLVSKNAAATGAANPINYTNLTIGGNAGIAKTLVASLTTNVSNKLLMNGNATSTLALGTSSVLTYTAGATLEYTKGGSATVGEEWPAANGPANIIINGNNVLFSTTVSTNRTIPTGGSITLNGGAFTVGSVSAVANVLTMANGSSMIKLTDKSFNVSGGTYTLGTTATDTVNVIIGSNTATPFVTKSGGELAGSYVGNVSLTIYPGFTDTLAGSRLVSKLILNGTLADGGFTLTNKGNITGTGSHTGTGKISMSGNTVASTISGASFTNLELNDADGFTLSGSPTVSGALTLTAGILGTSTNTLTINSAGSVTKTAGWVNGNLKKYIPASATTATFEIGDAATNYTPVTTAFSGTITDATGSITAKTTATEHPQIASSGLNSTKSVNRYYTLTNNNVIPGLTSYSPTFTFVAGDIDAGATTSSFLIKRYASSAWSSTTLGSANALNTSATGVSGFGDFAIGQLLIPTISTTGTGSLLGFNTTVGVASASQSFALSGIDMNAGILVTAPSGFEVSTDDISFNSSLTAGSSGSISSTTIYLRLAASAPVASYNGLTVDLTSSGATTVNVTIPNSSVTATAVAAVSVSTTSISAFAKTAVGSSSTSSSFTVSGTNLGSNAITITAPTNFKVSTSSGSGFGTSVILTPSSGSVSATTIYANYSPTGSGSNSGNLTISQADVSDQAISVSGSISTFYYQSGSPSTTTNWNAVSNGSGDNTPADFATAGITYKILNNATTDAAWTVSGTGSKIVVGDAGSSAATLTIASGAAITGTIDVAAASSGSNSVILQTATQPTFGSLHSSSEIHYRAAMSITTVPTDGLGFGKFIVDGGASYTVTLGVTGNTIIQSELTVAAGSKMITSATSTNFITINNGGSANINGTMQVAKAKGLIVAGVNGSLGGAIGFLVTDNLTLGTSSTIEYNKGTNFSTYNISPRTDYANLTISGLDNNKAITGACAISGIFTLNITGTSTITGTGYLTFGNSASIVMTSGAFDAAPAGFGTSLNLTYNGSAAVIPSFEMPSSSTVLNNLTINNAGGVYLYANTTVNGILTLTSGALNVNSYTLTLAGGPISVAAGTLVTTSSSNIIFSGSNAGPFTLPSSVTDLNNLTINNTNGTPATVSASAGLTLSGTLALTSGNLAMGTNALTLNGPAISGTGNLTSTGALSFGGTNAGPVKIPATITSITSLTLNNTNATPATLNLNGALACTSLALSSGTLADGGYTLTVNGNISGTGTHSGTGKIKITGTSRTISAVRIQNFEVGTGAVVSSAAATFSGNFEMNGGNFASNTGNVVTFNNGVTITRTSGNLSQGGGQYTFGASSSDVINVIINGDLNATSELPSTSATYYIGIINLTVNAGKTFTFANANRVINNLALNGNIADGGQSFTIKGNISGTGTHTGAGKISMSGNTVASTISAVTLNNVDFNDADGFTLNGTLTVNGAMNLVAGNVTTGSNILKANSTVSRTSGWVIGNLQKPVTAIGSYDFEVGTTAYSPASMNVTTLAASGNMIVKANTGLSAQSAYASLELNTAAALNRYWTVSAADGLGSTYEGTYTFVTPGDLIGSPTLSSLKSAVNTSSNTWIYPGTVSASTSTSVTAASTSSFGDVAFASPIAITVTADNISKNENDADPALTYSVTGSLGSGASFTGSISRVAGEAVGVYSIGQGTLAISPNPNNYSFTFVPGNFSILGTANPITNLISTHKSNNIVRLTWSSPI